MSNVYDFRPGRSVRGCDAQKVGEALERIRDEEGALTPENTVEAAADKESPLHPAFEWDDTRAAKQHRLAQARRLIISVRILNTPTGKPTLGYVSVRTPEKGRAYVPVVEAMSNEALKARVLAEVLTFIESLERRYSHFREVGEALRQLKQLAG